MQSFDVEKLAALATEYCVSVSEGKKIGITADVVASPLIQQVYKHILLKGGIPVPSLRIDSLLELLFIYGTDKQISFVSPFDIFFFSEVDGIIDIIAENNLKRMTNIPPAKLKQWAASRRERYEIFSKRLFKVGHYVAIPYSTHAFAQEAEMSLFEYEVLIMKACFLDKRDPVKEWKKLSEMQGDVVKRLNKAKNMRFIGEDTDLKLSVERRKWVSCDGHLSMPDGEVFTCPIENSAQGQIRFRYPTNYMCRVMEDVTLTFKNGKIVKAEAEKGQDFLKEILKTDEGAKRIGEIAVGTNSGIPKFTKNMLFDAKMAQSMHLTLGLSTPAGSGKNHSSIHLELLKDMHAGEIYADKELVYQKGKFVL